MDKARCQLACSFRWFARLNMNEGIANHFSYMLNEHEFLVNGFGRHFATIKASELLLVDLREGIDALLAKKGPNGKSPLIDPTAVCIHGAAHQILGSRARCIMHLHPHYTTALACLDDPSLPPIDQNTMRFFNRLAIDKGFDGMGLGDLPHATRAWLPGRPRARAPRARLPALTPARTHAHTISLPPPSPPLPSLPSCSVPI